MAEQNLGGALLRPVGEIIPGDRIDLEGDRYADPNGDTIAYQSEYAQADGVEFETPDCTVVHFTDGPSIGFPADWKVKVDPSQSPQEREANRAEYAASRA